MAVTIAEFVAEVASTSNASTYAMSAGTPTANDLLVVMAFATATVSAGSMTGGSLTWIRRASIAYAAGVNTGYLFTAQVGASPVSTTITLDVTGDAGTGCLMHAWRVAGHNRACPIRQIKTNSASSTNATTGSLVAACDTTSGVIAGWSGGLGSNVSTPPTSWTETADTSITSPSANSSAAFRATGETGSTITFTNATTAWGLLFVEINEATRGFPAQKSFQRITPQAVPRVTYR